MTRPENNACPEPGPIMAQPDRSNRQKSEDPSGAGSGEVPMDRHG